MTTRVGQSPPGSLQPPVRVSWMWLIVQAILDFFRRWFGSTPDTQEAKPDMTESPAPQTHTVGLGGILNGGNTCYIASALQLINSCEPYRQLFNHTANPLQPRGGESPEATQTRTHIQVQIYSLLEKIKLGLRITVKEINELRTELRESGVKSSQEDGSFGSSPELLLELLALMDFDTATVSSIPVETMFDGQRTRLRDEPISLIILPIGGEPKMADLLRVSLHHEYDGVKLADPGLKVLQITAVQGAAHKGKICEASTIQPFGKRGPIYDLMGVIEHSPGHYTARVRAGKKVYQADDSVITEHKSFDCCGELYVYVRRTSTNHKTLPDNNQASSSHGPSKRRRHKHRRHRKA